MKCFKCSQICTTSNHLIAHLKSKHKSKTIGEFFCTGITCGQVFNNLHRYKKHLNTHFAKPSNHFKTSKDQCSSNFEFMEITEDEITDNSINETSASVEDVPTSVHSKRLMLKEEIDKLEQNALGMLLEFHKKK